MLHSLVDSAGRIPPLFYLLSLAAGDSSGLSVHLHILSRMGGIVRELFRHYHSVIPERSRGISRHVPVDLVRWLDFARHDSMIAADRFSDSPGRGGTVYVPERLITFAEIVFFL